MQRLQKKVAQTRLCRATFVNCLLGSSDAIRDLAMMGIGDIATEVVETAQYWPRLLLVLRDGPLPAAALLLTAA
jgi:hypothetical protein